ncbi:MAG: hypothetical protein KC900_05740 [Candidatus Omnitrophica bacterium]|nr:hypothetical protein [Candidatus Omnitrophota bacterium]
MAKSSSTSNSKPWPWAFLIALTVIIIIESLVVVFDERFYYPPFNNLRMKVKNEISRSADRHYDVLILGDSFNLTGLDPALLTADTELSAFNYGTFAVNSVITSYVLLRNSLKKKGPKPRYLIIGYLDYIPQFSKDYIYKKYAHTLFDFKQGNIGVFTAEFGPALGLKFLIPTLKHQGYFLLNAKPTPPEKIRAVRQSVSDKRGFYEWHAEREFDGNIDYINTDDEFYVTPYFEKYIRKILTLCARNDIKVLYIMPTVVPELDKRLTAAGRRAAYMAYLRGLKEEYPNMDIIYPAVQLSDPRLYTDQDHLNARGGAVLSDMARGWLRGASGPAE